MGPSSRHKGATKARSDKEDIYDKEWFLTNPSEAGAMLRKMHAKADPRRTRLLTNLRSCIFEERTEQEFHQLFQAGLPQALLDVAAHPELYDDFRTNGVSNPLYGQHLPAETVFKIGNW